MKIIKKNQLTILVLSLMLVTAGYLNYNSSIQTSTEVATIGDATLVSANASNSINVAIQNQVEETSASTSTNDKTVEEANKIAMNKKEPEKEVASSVSTTEENIVETSAELSDIKEYFTSTRLDRDTMYSQMLESYQKILDSSTTSNKQKEAAQKEIDNINKIKNAIMICENLIKTKGFDDVIILSNDDSISVVVNKEEIGKEDIAQIQSIIAREMNAKIDDIHIMNK